MSYTEALIIAVLLCISVLIFLLIYLAKYKYRSYIINNFASSLTLDEINRLQNCIYKQYRYYQGQFKEAQDEALKDEIFLEIQNLELLLDKVNELKCHMNVQN